MSTPNPYTRLTRNAAGLASYSSLWLASDHLMIVESTGYSEAYARVMLRDIKGFFVVPSDRALFWNIAWGAITAIAAVRFVLVLVAHDTPIGSALFLGVGLAGLIINFVLGPSCRVTVLTRVQTRQLPALVRRKKVRGVLTRLEPMIAAAQADLVAGAPVPPVAAAAVGDAPPALGTAVPPAS